MKTIRILFSWSIILTIALLLAITACQKTAEDEATLNTADQSVKKAPIKLPYVRTLQITDNNTGTSVTAGISVSLVKGSSPVTECGIIWSPINMAKLGDEGSDSMVLGDTTGTFFATIGGLTHDQFYFFRGYAINSEGIAYDTYEVVSVTDVMSNSDCPDFVTDDDGNSYSVVQIGGQCWMAENLKVGTMITGGTDADPTNGIVEKYCYNNSAANCEEYGALYQWDEMMQSADPSVTNPSMVQGICPYGWHIPSFSEISQLTNEIGGTDEGGGKLKEIGTQHWLRKNIGATDEYDFTSLGAGQYSMYSNSFRNLKVETNNWSTTTYTHPMDTRNWAWTFRHQYNYTSQDHWYMDRDKMSLAVRCVKDYPQ
ncbi:MAG TPA: FISUMP domain-containing protein [Bacteroidales bacterium]|nr:FISUMP domain-containing protein [Bacteroidales bacterium]HRZ20898.1 FISUMP domain-containing protein [Bacteroidales bacterium]